MRAAIVIIAALGIGSCVGPPKPAPPLAPRPLPVVVTTPPPVPLGSDWRDWPFTPGNWTYSRDGQGSVAWFGAATSSVHFAIRCVPSAGTITLTRAGSTAAPGAMTIRTSTAVRTIAAQADTPAGMTASVSARDSLLDAMGFSRGRFVVEQTGLPALVLPAWAEVERVVEDCRR